MVVALNISEHLKLERINLAIEQTLHPFTPTYIVQDIKTAEQRCWVAEGPELKAYAWCDGRGLDEFDLHEDPPRKTQRMTSDFWQWRCSLVGEPRRHGCPYQPENFEEWVLKQIRVVEFTLNSLWGNGTAFIVIYIFGFLLSIRPFGLFGALIFEGITGSIIVILFFWILVAINTVLGLFLGFLAWLNGFIIISSLIWLRKIWKLPGEVSEVVRETQELGREPGRPTQTAGNTTRARPVPPNPS
jgi:hypothetical protein